MPSADDNYLYECEACHAVVERRNPLERVACPKCGHDHFTQILLTTVCDFCATTENVRWGYRCEDFETPWIVGTPHQVSRGDWAACDECKALIEANDREGLARHALKMEGMEGNPGALVVVKMLHDGFFRHRVGGAYAEKEVQRG